MTYLQGRFGLDWSRSWGKPAELLALLSSITAKEGASRRMGRIAELAEELLEDSQGICVLTVPLADPHGADYLAIRSAGGSGELVRYRDGKKMGFRMSAKALESLVGSLKTAGILELETIENWAEMLDGELVGVATKWGDVDRAYEVLMPKRNEAIDVVQKTLRASNLSLRLKCLLGNW